MTKAGANLKLADYLVSLSDGVEEWGINPDGGIKGIQEIPQTPSNLMVNSAGKRYGDGDPTFSHIEQSSWSGGRAQDDFEDNTRYYSGQNLWSVTSGRLLNGLQWKMPGTDHRNYEKHLPGNVAWKALRSDTRYIATKFTASASYDADKVYLWVRRVGNPGTLRVDLYSDSGGDPDSSLKYTTKTTSDITDIVSVFQVFDWTSTQALTSGTDYHIVISGASSDDANNHWQVGVDTSGTSSSKSSDASSWTSENYTAYYYLVDADSTQRWHWFVLNDTELYAANQPSTGDSELYKWDETNKEWDSVTIGAGDSLSGIVKSVCVANDIAHIARGTGAADETIYTFQYESSTYSGQDDATAANKADHVWAFNDPVDGPQIWRAENDNNYVSRSDVKAFNTDLSFGDDIELPEEILGLCDYNDQMWTRTDKNIFSIKNDRPSKLNTGISAIPDTRDYCPITAVDLFLYFGWSFSMERLYSGTLDDVGPWREAGLPDGRQGKVSFITRYLGYIFAGIDGGTGNTSSVLMYDGLGWHEFFTAWESGQRIQNGFIQAQNGTTSPARLWVNIGTDMIYFDLPDESLNPLRDSTVNYMHESVIISSTHDLNASAMKKLFKSIDVTAQNLGTSRYIGVDYQVDDDVGSDDWIELTNLSSSPFSSAILNLGNKHQMRYRLRLNTNSSTEPIELKSVVLKGFVKTPVKRQWNMVAKISDIAHTRRGTKVDDPRDFYRWYLQVSENAQELLLRGPDELMDNIYVIAEQPSLFRQFNIAVLGWLGGKVPITLREA